tara:strand:- start:595 stop:1233 length:639 start_codon:yes stop_codon:yes gene_type:complete
MNGWMMTYNARLVELLKRKQIVDHRVLHVVEQTPRYRFLDSALVEKSFDQTALPIGFGQTISQPYISALMMQTLLQHQVQDSVLEIGTGSGYQTAMMAKLFTRVATIERIKALQISARRRLKQQDIHNVQFKYGDGWQGWEAKGAYDGIVVTASVPEVPEILLKQLKLGGCLLIPVGETHQELACVVRHKHRYETKMLETVRFAPLVRGDLD